MSKPTCPKCSREMTAWGFVILNERDAVLWTCDGDNTHGIVREAR